MKKLRIILASFIIVMVCVTISFAAEKSNLNPNAVYEITDSEGQPISLKFDYTHCEFVDFPKAGDKVNVWYDGDTSKDPDEVGVYGERDKKTGFFKSDGSRIYYGDIGRDGKDYDISNSTVSLRFYYSDSLSAYRYNITQTIGVEATTPAVERIEYCFSSLTVKPEEVSMYEDGKRYLTMWAREHHYTSKGVLIESPFCPGESVNLYFSDGTSKTYYCEDVLTSWGLWLAGFVAKDGDTILLDVEEPVDGVWLREGDNDVKIMLMSRKDVAPFILKVYVGDKPSDQGGQEAAIPVATSSEPKALNASTVSKIKAKRSGSKMTISWKKATAKQQKAFGKIEVQYSDNKKFINAKSKYIKKNKASCTIKKLNKKKNYYVRVRKIKKTNGETYVSKWSKTKTIKK
ncbi:MAG: fibronectin type III domain-containing protein [Mogibacterium sp.]|nr:fibronectin type III domain-containing protein [Mogibacterium sp.]